MIRHLCATLSLLAAPVGAMALDVGESDFVYSSDLMNDGATPFPVTGSANAIYGLQKGTDLYLCFVADNSERQAVRQTLLLAELNGTADTRTLPNIPVICVMTQ